MDGIPEAFWADLVSRVSDNDGLSLFTGNKVDRVLWGRGSQNDLFVVARQGDDSVRKVMLPTQAQDERLNWKESLLLSSVLGVMNRGCELGARSEFEGRITRASESIAAASNSGPDKVFTAVVNKTWLGLFARAGECEDETRGGDYIHHVVLHWEAASVETALGDSDLRKFVLGASTSNGHFQVEIVVGLNVEDPQETYTAESIDCLRLALVQLRQGELMTRDAFLEFGAKIREKYFHACAAEMGSESDLLLVAVPFFERLLVPLPPGLLPDNVAPLAQGLNPPAGGAAPIDVVPLPGAPTVPGAVITAAISRGGQATVYAGVRIADHTECAIKVYETMEDLQEAETEINALLELAGHPNLVQVYGHGETTDSNRKPYIMMELVRGCDLHAFIKNAGGPLDADLGAKFIMGICDGIGALHSRRLVHRDLKSLNVMIDAAKERAIIIDLGLAKERDVSMAMQVTQGLKGSLPWTAPEMISEMTWTEKVDVYAVGVIIWEILSGLSPYDGDPRARRMPALIQLVAGGGRPDMRRVKVSSPRAQELSKLMCQCWDQDPDKRPSALEVSSRLRGEDTPIEAVPASITTTNPNADMVARSREVFATVAGGIDNELDLAGFLVYVDHLFGSEEIDIRRALALFEGIDVNASGTVSFSEFLPFFIMVRRSDLDGAVNAAMNDFSGEVPTEALGAN